MNLNITPGCIIQIATSNNGAIDQVYHSMFVTGYDYYNGDYSYTVSYHTTDTLEKNILEVCANNSDKIFLLYEF